jgi:hypothetical protein
MRLDRLVRVLAGVVVSLAVSGCLDGAPPDGAARCAATPPDCPNGYYCAPDSTCWRTGHVPPSLCSSAPPTAICDGFEAPAINSDIWSLQTDKGEIMLDTSRAYRGRASLKIQDDMVGPMTIPQVWLNTGGILAVPHSDVWMRAFYFIPSPLPQGASLLLIGQDASPHSNDGVIVEDDGALSVYTNFASDAYHTSDVRLPVGKWSCLEWHVHLTADANGFQEIFVDGVAGNNVSAHGATDGSPRVTSMAVGFWWAPPQTQTLPQFAVWVDEVEMDTARVGCAR